MWKKRVGAVALHHKAGSRARKTKKNSGDQKNINLRLQTTVGTGTDFVKTRKIRLSIAPRKVSFCTITIEWRDELPKTSGGEKQKNIFPYLARAELEAPLLGLIYKSAEKLKSFCRIFAK